MRRREEVSAQASRHPRYRSGGSCKSNADPRRGRQRNHRECTVWKMYRKIVNCWASWCFNVIMKTARIHETSANMQHFLFPLLLPVLRLRYFTPVGTTECESIATFSCSACPVCFSLIVSRLFGLLSLRRTVGSSQSYALGFAAPTYVADPKGNNSLRSPLVL